MIIKISRHRDGWKKFVGGKRFYSATGMDRETFRLIAGALEVRWQGIRANGGSCWTEAEIDAAYEAAGVTRGNSDSAATTVQAVTFTPPTSGSGRLYLHAAVEKYLTHLKSQVPKVIGIDHYEKCEQQVRRLKKLMPDAPVARIEYDDLVQLKNDVLNGKKLNGDPFAVDTIPAVICDASFFVRSNFD